MMLIMKLQILFPEGVDSFVQKWNTWSHTQVDTKTVKELVDQVHKSGAVAMLYNMISADSNPKNPALPLVALAYNFYDSFGEKGEPMTTLSVITQLKFTMIQRIQIGKIHRRCHEISYGSYGIRWLARVIQLVTTV